MSPEQLQDRGADGNGVGTFNLTDGEIESIHSCLVLLLIIRLEYDRRSCGSFGLRRIYGESFLTSLDKVSCLEVYQQERRGTIEVIQTSEV